MFRCYITCYLFGELVGLSYCRYPFLDGHGVGGGGGGRGGGVGCWGVGIEVGGLWMVSHSVVWWDGSEHP